MAVPRPGTESKLQLRPVPGNTGSFNILHWARNRTYASAVTWAAAVGVLIHCTTVGIPHFLLIPLLLSLPSPSVTSSLLTLLSAVASLNSQQLYPVPSVKVEGKHFLNLLTLVWRLIWSFTLNLQHCSYCVLPLDGT